MAQITGKALAQRRQSNIKARQERSSRRIGNKTKKKSGGQLTGAELQARTRAKVEAQQKAKGIVKRPTTITRNIETFSSSGRRLGRRSIRTTGGQTTIQLKGKTFTGVRDTAGKFHPTSNAQKFAQEQKLIKTAGKFIQTSSGVSGIRAVERDLKTGELIVGSSRFVKAKLRQQQGEKQQFQRKKQAVKNKAKLNKFISQNKIPRFKDLTNEGFTNAQANEILKAFELSSSELNKLKEVSFDKLWDKLNTKSNIIVDKRTGETAYKVSINQELEKKGFNKIDFKKPIREFSARLNTIKKYETKVKKDKIRNEIKNLNLKPTTREALINQIVTGKALTDSQQKEFWLQVALKGAKELPFLQLKLAGKNIITSFNYGKNLVNRFKKGENNPLFNDLIKFKFNPKKAGIGALKEIGDTINFFLGVKGITINSKGQSFDGVIAKGSRALIEYTSNIVNAYSQGLGKQKLKADLRKLATTSKFISKSSVDVGNFIKEKPILTAFIVSGAIATGIIKSKKSFFANPDENVGRALVWLFPGTIIKGVARLTQINKVLKLKTIKVNKFKTETQTKFSSKTGKSETITKVNGVINSKTLGGDKIKTTYNLKINAENKRISGEIFFNVNGKQSRQTINYVDEGAFFLDTKTKRKIKKDFLPITERSFKFKQQTITDPKKTTILSKNDIAIKKEATIEDVTLSIVNGVSKETKRTSRVVLVAPSKKENQIILGLTKRIDKITKKKRTTKFKPLTLNELKFIKDYMTNFVRYDKVIFEGLDRRSRLAKALGITKTNPVIKTFENVLDKATGKVKGVIIREITTKEKGIEVTKLFPKFKIKITKSRPLSLLKNKKGQFNINKNRLEFEIITDKKKTNRVIEIPQFKAPLPTSQIKLKKLGLLTLVKRLQTQIKLFNTTNLKKFKTQQDLKKLNESTKILKQSILKINSILKTFKLKNGVIQKIITTKLKTISKKSLRTSRQKTPPPKKFNKLIIRIDFDSKKINNRIVRFRGTYRERRNPKLNFNAKTNKRVTKTYDKITTKNRLLKFLGNIADKELVRAISKPRVIALGKKVKDIPKPNVLKKFKKTKKGFLEMPRFAFDSPNEKFTAQRLRKLAQSKKTKKIKPTKTKKRVTSTKKTKKSSNIKPKRKLAKTKKKTRKIKKKSIKKTKKIKKKSNRKK